MSEHAKMTFEQLLNEVASSRDFRVQLIENPRAALESKGLTPTDDMIQALQGLDRDSLARVAQAFRSGTHADFGC